MPAERDQRALGRHEHGIRIAPFPYRVWLALPREVSDKANARVAALVCILCCAACLSDARTDRRPNRHILHSEEKVVGEFRTNDCGTCAAACVASYHTVSNTLGSARYELLEGVDAMQLADQVALNRTLRTRECPMCTEWVFCPPYASVSSAKPMP